MKGDTEGVELPVVQCMKCARSLDAADVALEYLSLRWAAADGGKNESKEGRSVKENDFTVAGEFLGAT